MCVRSFYSLFPAQQDESCAGKHNEHAAEEIEQVGAGGAGGGEGDAGLVAYCYKLDYIVLCSPIAGMPPYPLRSDGNHRFHPLHRLHTGHCSPRGPSPCAGRWCRCDPFR